LDLTAHRLPPCTAYPALQVLPREYGGLAELVPVEQVAAQLRSRRTATTTTTSSSGSPSASVTQAGSTSEDACAVLGSSTGSGGGALQGLKTSAGGGGRISRDADEAALACDQRVAVQVGA
jgi:hypothetical protein